MENIKYLNDLTEGKAQIKDQKQEDITMCQNIAKTSLKFLKLDFDGYYILDYLGKEFIEPMKQTLDTEFSKIFVSAFNFVESEYRRFVREGDNKLTHRYYFLYQYFLQNKDYCLS